MAIFNSLGSNYRWREIMIATKQIFCSSKKAFAQMQQELENFFQGKAVFLFNGRDAIEYCLRSFEIGSADQVLTQAFSCSSLEEAINRVGAQAVYYDLQPEKLQTSLTQIQTAYRQAKNPKAVIVQHTLGYVDELSSIAAFCHEHNLLLIADLAQAVGATAANGQALGLQADAIILSFGRDKILDAVVGGAVILRKSPTQDLSSTLTQPIKTNILPLLLYPHLTWKIRTLYGLGIGKFFHWLAQKLGLMTTAIASPHSHYQAFPKKFSLLLLHRWQHLSAQLRHRRKLAQFYFSQLQGLAYVKLPITELDIKSGTNLRFPLLLNKSEAVASLLTFLAQHQVYLFDRWYRQAVDSGQMKFTTSYVAGSCPQAEILAQRIINLPTHQNLSLKQAQEIINLIINWNQSQL